MNSGYWRTKRGELIPLEEMPISYLQNCLRLLKKRIEASDCEQELEYLQNKANEIRDELLLRIKAFIPEE